MAATNTATSKASKARDSNGKQRNNDCESVVCSVLEDGSTASTLARSGRNKRSKQARRLSFLSRTRKMWSSSRTVPSCSPTTVDKAGSSTKSVRKVRFSKVVQFRKILPVSCMTLEEKSDIWFTANERELMRKQARVEAWKARIRKPRFEAVLNEAFNNALYLATITADYDCLEGTLEKKAQDLLPWTTCVRNKDSFRGLENSFSRFHRFSRPELVPRRVKW